MLERIRQSLISLLRWSEKYTKTDMVFVFLTTYWSFVAQLMSSAAALLLALFVAHYIAKSDYGTYQYVISLMGTLSIFSLTGLGNAVLQSVARGFDQSLPDGFWLNLKWSFGVALGAIVIGGYYFYDGNDVLGTTILVAGLLAPLTSSINLYGWFLNGKKDARRSSLYPNGIGNVMPMLGIIIGGLLLHNAAGLVLGYVITNLCTAAFLFWRSVNIHPLNNQHDSGLKRYGFHLSAAGVLSTIAGNLDNLVIFHFLGAADVAVYNFAVSVPDQTKGPLGMLGTMMTARFSNQQSASIRSSMKNKILWLFLTNASIALIYWVCAPFIYQILFPAYVISINYSRFYALSLIFGMFAPAGAYLSAHKLVKEQYANSIFFSVFQIGALFIGVVVAGVAGVIFARILSRAASNFFSYFLYRRSVRSV